MFRSPSETFCSRKSSAMSSPSTWGVVLARPPRRRRPHLFRPPPGWALGATRVFGCRSHCRGIRLLGVRHADRARDRLRGVEPDAWPNPELPCADCLLRGSVGNREGDSALPLPPAARASVFVL